MSTAATPATHNLLVELFVEELPPKALKKLSEAFGSALQQGLRDRGLAGDLSALNLFATPRRLAARVSHVLAAAADRAETVKLMPVSVGLDAEGRATPALLKKLAAIGADAGAVSDLKRQGAGKAEVLMLDRVVAGALLADGLQQVLDEAIAALPVPKLMQYQLDGGSTPGLQPGWTSVRFVRPAHALVALHGADVVPVRALGLDAGRQTRGHRFEAQVDPVVVQHADHYERQLEDQGAVIASFSARRAEIARQLAAAAAQQGLRVVDDDALLDEVTALVERPNVLVCRFDEAFLAVPPECLVLTMKANQKYFPLVDEAGRLTHRFLVVSAISPADPSRVVEGNERVVRPRLADAAFFFDQDRKRTLASRVPELARVVYHGKLGSQGQRVERVRAIARQLGERIGGAALGVASDRAAELAKADLLTEMVGEFPELQGVMGGYYARHDGETDAVAMAVEDHYRPRYAGDDLPRGDAGVVVALADKLETLAGLFGIGQAPTGDRDPYALRRAAFGVLRLLIERQLALPLGELVDLAWSAFAAGALDDGARATLETFLFERLEGLLRDKGYTAREVDAVVSMRPADIRRVPDQLAAVRVFQSLPEAEALAAANKRVVNILKKVSGELPSQVDPARLVEPAEMTLHDALATAAPLADAAFDRGDYTGSLQSLAVLKQPVDDFFDQVMVNAPDAALRDNRLALLARLRRAMNRVADLSRLA